MKFSCPCGNIIVDNSDFHAFKASVIADQDREDFRAFCVEGDRHSYEAFAKYGRTLYQCDRCARLFLAINGDLISFKPERESCPTNLLRSVEGEHWKRHLRGKWDGRRGEVWWGFGVEDEGFLQNLASGEDVKKVYFEVFERLKSKNVLRDSFLRIEYFSVLKLPEL